MNFSIKHALKTISCVLVAAIVVGLIPWRELSANSNTHGEYSAYPLKVTYDQNSTWGYSTQGQYTLKNESEYDVKSWTLEIDYGGNVKLQNIWNAKDITNYDTDDKITVSYNSTISAGQTYTFGLIADGKNAAPVAPSHVSIVAYDSNEPVEAPAADPTATEVPVITEEAEATSTPTEAVAADPTNTATATPTPAPAAEPEEEPEVEIFPYAIFAGSRSTDFTFQGWKSNIVGDIYTGRNFVYQGSELYVDGTIRTVGNMQSSGWKTKITATETHVDALDIPDWSAAIKAKESVLPKISSSSFRSQKR